MSISVRIAGVFVVLAVFLSACGSAGAPARSVTATTTAASPIVPPSSPPSSGPKPGQTDTDWGRIWDSLPPGFPTYPGGTPDESAAGGAASAVIVVDGLDPKDAATFLQTLLEKAGYTTVGSLDPLEDGSVVLEMTGSPDGCAIQATASPTGSVTTVRILYGADCAYG